MWIAETSTSDGIAIVLFATVLLLILFGIVAIVKWIFRLVTGKPDPTKIKSLVLVLESEMHEENLEPDNHEKIRIFAFYLHSKLAGKKIGQLANLCYDTNGYSLFFQWTRRKPDLGFIEW